MTSCYKTRDAYFTIAPVAVQVWAHALSECARFGLDPSKVHWIEPSAGAGAFITTKPACVKRLTCIDIHPLHPAVRKADFLQTTRQGLGIINGEPVVIIGNPPFGRQAASVLKFINFSLAALDAKFVCFIVPPLCASATFHNRMLQPIGMASALRLTKNAFETPDGKAFNLGTAPYAATFAFGAPRLIRPLNQHPDFTINGLHTEKADDLRLKNPVPHRFHAIKRICAGGYAFGYKPTTGEIVLPNEMPVEWDDFDGYGAIYLVYANRNRITDAELLRRWKTIDWQAILDANKKAGNVIGNISPKHVVAAYNKIYGGLDNESQTSLDI